MISCKASWQSRSPDSFPGNIIKEPAPAYPAHKAYFDTQLTENMPLPKFRHTVSEAFFYLKNDYFLNFIKNILHVLKIIFNFAPDVIISVKKLFFRNY